MGTFSPVKSEPVILFDGLCNLCNGSVQFIIKRDAAGYFRFASLQSAAGQFYLRQFDLPLTELTSVILIKDRILFQKSNAALEIVRGLDGLWPALYILKIIPLFLRDWVYTIIAKNRYHWFGKMNVCMIPTPELKSRFLE